jgi:hypothetical protein
MKPSPNEGDHPTTVMLKIRTAVRDPDEQAASAWLPIVLARPDHIEWHHASPLLAQ